MKTRVILEFGCNHQGEMKIAKQMIDEAVKLGVWGIKFQKRDIESIPEEIKNKSRNMNNSFGNTYYEHRKALEFSKEELKELMNYTFKKDLKFICTAFDEKSVNDLAEIGCPIIKLPSQLYTCTNLKEKLIDIRLHDGINIWVSTGMHNEEEILNNSWIDQADVIFHCISIYPACLTHMNLNTIIKLKELSTAMIGYSSHENEGNGIKYAVIAGARYIERHFTLDKEMKGSDHGTVSSDPAEIKKILADIEYVERILGDKRNCNLKEKQVRKIYRGF